MTTFALPSQGLPITASLVSFHAERVFGCLAAVAIVFLLAVVVMVARARPAGPWNTVMARRRRTSAAGRAPRATVAPVVAGGGLR